MLLGRLCLGHRRSLEFFSSQQRGARLDAGSTRLFANGAMAVMLGVAGAFLRAGHAGTNAGVELQANGRAVPLGRT